MKPARNSSPITLFIISIISIVSIIFSSIGISYGTKYLAESLYKRGASSEAYFFATLAAGITISIFVAYLAYSTKRGKDEAIYKATAILLLTLLAISAFANVLFYIIAGSMNPLGVSIFISLASTGWIILKCLRG